MVGGQRQVTMQNDIQIHGHEVMQMMLDSGSAYTRESLRQAIIDRFGAEARFFTCSAEDLTAEALIEFLAERGKFISSEEGFNTAPAKMCHHDHDHEHEHEHEHEQGR
jgi:probable metal-binding protein